jgi:protein-S-isoprenylcysteine O-methyltransferase Ste14
VSPALFPLLLVGVQAAAGAALVLDTRWRGLSLPVAAALAASAALGAWAVATVGLRHLRIMPEPAPGAPLRVRGPYAVVRHPMYASLFYGSAALLWHQWSLPRLALVLALWVDLHLKMGYEERRLAERFPGYGAYCRRTWRVLPPLY